MRPRFSVREEPDVKSTDSSLLLPIDRAFVLQFEPDCPTEREDGAQACGRVEHVVTGRASRFRGFDELRLFVSEVLRESAVKRGEAK